MLHEPKLLPAVVLSMLGISLIIFGWFIWSEGWSPFVYFLLFLNGVSGLLFAALYLCEWLLHQYVVHLRNRRRIEAITPEAELLERQAWLIRSLSTLTKEQLHEIALVWPRFITLSGEPYGSDALKVGEGEIPKRWIEWYLSKSNDEFLYPVRYLTSERDQMWARWLIEHMLKFGWIAPAHGNLPARWLQREKAYRAMKIQLAEEA